MLNSNLKNMILKLNVSNVSSQVVNPNSVLVRFRNTGIRYRRAVWTMKIRSLPSEIQRDSSTIPRSSSFPIELIPCDPCLNDSFIDWFIWEQSSSNSRLKERNDENESNTFVESYLLQAYLLFHSINLIITIAFYSIFIIEKMLCSFNECSFFNSNSFINLFNLERWRTNQEESWRIFKYKNIYKLSWTIERINDKESNSWHLCTKTNFKIFSSREPRHWYQHHHHYDHYQCYHQHHEYEYEPH